jgi:cytochrome c peroxidase
MISNKYTWVQLGIAFLAFACSATEQAMPSLFSVPNNFPKPVYDVSKNPVTQAGFELGKALFNDGLLSRDGSVSCGDCHLQNYAFTHHGHDVSHGIDNRKGIRNAPSIQNMAWQKDFFWDGGVGDLDMFSIAPIENPLEMDEKLGNVLAKLRKTSTYPAMFKKAYGSEEITTQGFLKALSQFMLTLVSANSRYDKYIRNEGVMLTDDEIAGIAIFKQKCASCHTGELFTDNSYRNNGLAIQGTMDVGRYRITEIETDRYRFKVPSLRNVAVTQPYMHDGRFYTLEVVLDHYADNVQNTPNLDPILKQGNKLGISLNAIEKKQLIAFLNTLTDNQFLTDKRFSE